MKLKRTINEKKIEINLCEDCARETGNIILPFFDGFGSIFSGLIGYNSPQPANKVAKNKACMGCGETLEQFYSTGKFGCAKCYDTFSEELVPLLKKIHGSSQYVSAAKEENGEKAIMDPEMVELKLQLKQAIEQEDFENAAVLRDKIKQLEEQPEN
jgi:protein arginine kinase activator